MKRYCDHAKEKLNDVLTSGLKGDRSDPTIRRVRFTNIFILTTMIALILFSFINLASKQYLGFALELAASIFGIFTIIQLRVTRNIKRAQTYVLLNITVVMSYLFASGGIAGTGIFWWFTFPVAAFFIKGRRGGWLWIAIIILEAIIMMLLGKCFSVVVPYSFVELRQFLAAFLIDSIVLQHYEATRDDYEKAIEANLKVLEEASSKIKTLKGLVPICSSCKKIRNDEGFWQHLEVYMSEHTEADFSHGICEECAEKLFPTDDENKDPHGGSLS